MQDQATGCTLQYLILSIIIIILATVVCVVSTVAYIDYDCAKNGKKWLPLYPGSEIIQEKQGYFRRYGFGETILVLHTPDDNNTVRKWYITQQRKNRLKYRSSGLAETDWAVIRTPNEAGTTVILTLGCVSK